MKIVEFNNNIFELKISIGDYIAIYQLGLIERLSTYPSTVDYLSFCNILLRRYHLDEDDLYDFMDYLTENFNINLFLQELLKDGGLLQEVEEEVEEVEEEVKFEDQLDNMLKDCLAFGMDVNTFYSMTFKEVKLFIEGIQQRTEMERRDRSMFDYLLANLITTGTGIVLGGKTSFPSYDDYYGPILGEEHQTEMELEGYATDDLGNKTPIYKPKFDADKDMARKELMAIAQQQKINSLQKELDKQNRVVE